MIDISPEWKGFVTQALSHWGADIFVARRVLGGRSGATVILVEIRTPKHDGLGILKLSEGAALEEEQSRQEIVRSSAPLLSQRIPAVTHSYTCGQYSALLMTVAGGGLLEAEVMASTNGPRVNLASQLVSNSLLREWNPSPTFDGKSVPANMLVREWLGDRFGPKSRVPDLLSKVLCLPPECPAFRYGGVDYPNPYAFSTPNFPGNGILTSPGRGLIHGDLHSENVLISGYKKLEYFFIDFESLQMSAPLFYDHSYLELHLLLLFRAGVSHQRWQQLCSSLAGLEDTSAVAVAADSDDHGILWTVGMIRAEIGKWIRDRFPLRQEDLKKQRLLSRVAAGLNFANKRSLADDTMISNKKKFFALLYSATAARELFEYCKLQVPDDGPIAQPLGETQSPVGDLWRDAWDACAGFNGRQAAYVLLAGEEAGKLPEHARAILGRLPWSLVIDFDRKGTSSELLRGASTALKRERGFHQIYPHQTTIVDFETGVCWLFADSDPSDCNAPPLPLSKWRALVLPRVRALASGLLRATAPRPVYLIILGGSIDPVRLRNTVSALDEAIGAALNTIVVSQCDADPTESALADEAATISNITCDWRDLALGVHQMLGDLTEARSVWIPARDQASKAIRREQIDPEDIALYSATVDIVSSGLIPYAQDETEGDVADFLKGNTISWRELDLHRDVDRDVTRRLLKQLRELLAGSPTESFAVEHSPGAGGTTVARRIAWELRDEFPSVILKAFTDDTADVIEALFQRSNLPILIVAEAARLPGTQRDLFFNDLKGRSIRFLILDVRRRHTPRNTESSVALTDPMSMGEARRFLTQYEARAPEDRRPALKSLVEDPDLSTYRSAFFFGLYTFERDFVRVELSWTPKMGQLAKVEPCP